MAYAKAWARWYSRKTGLEYVVVRTRGNCLQAFEAMPLAEALDGETQGYWSVAWARE